MAATQSLGGQAVISRVINSPLIDGYRPPSVCPRVQRAAQPGTFTEFAGLRRSSFAFRLLGRS